MQAAFLALGAGVLLGGTLRAQEEVASVGSEEVRIGGDERKRYFRIGPRRKEPPKAGYGLLVILPGGDGSAAFLPFCKRIYENACGDGFVAAQPVAVKWTEEQRIVWPTKGLPVEGMKFTTEELVEEVVADAAKWTRIDPARVFLLAWSSSGPAAYAISLSDRKSPTGYFIAMSVFKPAELPDLARAKGEAYYLYHSPEDRTCPIAMARDAERRLGKERAKVKLVEYAGGHGWHGPVFPAIRAGLDWLEKNRAPAPKPRR